ncbi:MAG: ABC transporter permease [Zhaonellaceae bacterium]|jgi:peptide/nickel transport system permease protein
MIRFIIQRLLQLIPAILISSFIIFFAMNLTGGDPAMIIAGDKASAERIEQVREEYGFNDPVPVQYIRYMAGLVRGDMGISYVTNKDVFKSFMARLPATMELAFASVFFAVLLSIPLGIYTAINQNTWKDNLGMVFALFGVSMPNFWLGLILILFFSLRLGWFPSGGRSGIISVVLPAATVGLGLAALITRTTRSAMLDVIRQDYIRTAKAKGASDRAVVYKHALGNALIPIITVIGLQLANVLTGSVLAESVFAWPGIARLIFDHISKRDTPMVTGSIILCSIMMCLVNTVVDIIYAFVDPRIKAQYVRKG